MNIHLFIGSIPGYWILFEAIELCLYRSKYPQWFGLYSTPKALTIVFLFATSWVAFRFLSVRIALFLDNLPEKPTWVEISPVKLFFFLTILCRLILVHVPLSVGEDVAEQFLSTKQWISADTSSPNLISSPNPENLSQNIKKWILRPPGASWLAIPGLLIGLSLGHAVQFILFILAIISGAGWLNVGKKLSLPHPALVFLTLILALNSTLSSISVSSASVLTAATFPWLISWALQIGKEWGIQNNDKRLTLQWIMLFLCIGLHAFFKLSSLFTLSAVALLPFLICFSTLINSKRIFFFRICVSVALFIAPYFLVTTINENMSGISSDELYSKQDYNLQHALWGKHFTESTKGGMLGLSFLGSTGYASHAQPLINKFRDFLLQSNYYSKLLDILKLNARILGSCILAIPITVLALISVKVLWGILDRNTLFLFISLFVVPFLGLGAISYHHGFNYLIFHAYTKEFSNIFIILGLSLVFFLNKQIYSKFLTKIKVGIFLGLPLITTVSNFFSVTINSSEKFIPSDFEIQQGFGSSDFSNAMKIVSDNSKDSNDVCFFLCAGDKRDYCLRIPMRSLSLHWAKDNIVKLSNLDSSVPINLYCVIDPILSKDFIFINKLKNKIPHGAEMTRLDPLVLKFVINSDES